MLLLGQELILLILMYICKVLQLRIIYLLHLIGVRNYFYFIC